MIETIFHFFKIHRKMILGNPPVIVQDMLGVTPEPLNAVNMILAFVRKRLTVIKTMMFAPAFQGVVASKGVGVIHRALPGVLSDMRHQLIGRDSLHDLGVHPAVSLQKPQDNALARCASAPLTFASTPEVGVINFNLTLELTPFQFRHVVQRLPQALVDSGDRLIVHGQIRGQTIGRLLLVETHDDANFLAQLFERLLLLAMAALQIAASRFTNFKRTTENALPTPQKVGRTLKNILFTSNHMGILRPDGYECH